ncbi:MAG: Rrf2 family transcriptional regulator [Candidatus Omnitrophica bacterium]|nr:Rrf2 family transcriptional regulator [Candidatus Omnitrophota bacterium]
MKISTKGRYSVRLMIDLATNGTQGFVLLKDVARRQQISEKYLGHLVPLLKNAGLISATRGAKGGFTLLRDPREVTLKDIISAVEGPICLVDCVDDKASCKKSADCAARDVWDEATRKIIQIFDGYTLDQLVQEQKKKQGVDNYAI